MRPADILELVQLDRRIEWLYCSLHQNQDGRHPGKFRMTISKTSHHNITESISQLITVYDAQYILCLYLCTFMLKKRQYLRDDSTQATTVSILLIRVHKWC